MFLPDVLEDGPNRAHGHGAYYVELESTAATGFDRAGEEATGLKISGLHEEIEATWLSVPTPARFLMRGPDISHWYNLTGRSSYEPPEWWLCNGWMLERGGGTAFY